MKKLLRVFCIIFFSCILFFACTSKDKISDYASAAISYKTYMPMQVGSVQLYRLDSTEPTAFGAQFLVSSFLAKDSVIDKRLDATGDTTFDVYRYLTDTLQTQPWTLATVYQITYTKHTGDLIQANGLRFVKLTTPVKNGNSWNGVVYFISANASLQVGDLTYPYYNWNNFTYDSSGMAYNNGYNNYPNTVIVNEVADTLPPNTTFDPTQFQQVYYSQEVYAQSVGLIYQNTVFYIYQPPSSFGAGYDPSSFGIKLRRIQ